MKEDCVYYIPPRRDEDESCIYWEHTNWECNGCKRYKNKYKKTNADHIRSMTDEDLAEFLWKYGGIGVCPPIECPAKDECGAEKCWLDWLKKEVEA